MRIEALVARASEHDEDPDNNVLWSSGPYDPEVRPLWEVAIATTWTQWGVGVEVNGEPGGLHWPSRLTFMLQVGPWVFYVQRLWRRKQ